MSNSNLTLKEVEGVKFFSSESLERLGFVKHFFSTRIGGVSSGSFGSLNLGIYTQDDPENIKSNLEIIFEAVGMNINRLVYLKQIHGSDFYLVNDKNYKELCGSDGDAIITTSRDIAIGVLTADCVPIIIADSVKKVVSVIHAGWKGTFAKIAEKVIEFMINELGSNPENIIAVIGPSIGPCCFEVKQDVADKFKFVSVRNGKLFVDLWKENEEQLLNMGLEKENIIMNQLCTMCSNDLFYSYRKEGPNTGRMGTFIQIT